MSEPAAVYPMAGWQMVPYSFKALGMNLGIPTGATIEDIIVQIRTAGGSGNAKPHLLKGAGEGEGGTMAELAIGGAKVWEGSPLSWGIILTPAEASNLGLRVDFTPSTSPDEIVVTEMSFTVKASGIFYLAEILTPTVPANYSAGARSVLMREVVIPRGAGGEALPAKSFCW